MMQKNCWFLLLFLTRQSLGWWCGGVEIAEAKQCKCGSDVLTYESWDWDKFRKGYPYRRQCCGPDTCSIDDNGDAICLDGVTCKTSWEEPWKCGNIIIAKEKTCQCGSSSPPLDSDQYRKGTWCCPTEPCTYQDDGTAVCHNATIVLGSDKGCDSGVCYNRYRLSCKSGNQCVHKSSICHGAPQCHDGSDVAACSPDNDENICPPDYSKCPSADIPTDHQEFYHSYHKKDNQEFDCITRGDETNTETEEELVDYDSMTTCDADGDPGLMCGELCKWVGEWCYGYGYGDTCTTFTNNNRYLCQNRTFWENISCGTFSGYEEGFRCKGTNMECVYPGNDKQKQACDDHSDATFPQNTTCSPELGWSTQLLCTESCDIQTGNCTACTNPDYFNCTINNVPSCIHPKLVCDGHPACDNSKDEDINDPECLKNLTRSGNIKPEATVLCTSKMYADKKMPTIAVACNGVVECDGGWDEGVLCTDQTMIVYGTMGVCILLLISTVVYKILKGFFGDVIEDLEPMAVIDVLDFSIFNKNHGKPEFQDEINLFIQKSKAMDSKTTRIAKNKKLYKLVSKFHNGNVAKTRLYIKNTLDWSNAKILLEDAFPGIVRRNMEWLENALETLDKKKFSYWLFNKVKTIFSIYIDICKDTFLMVSILVIIGGPASLYLFPTKLTSVVVYCFATTIVGPLLSSSILHTQRQLENHPEMACLRKFLAYGLSTVTSPIRPLIIAEAYEENKAKRKALIKFHRNKALILKLNREGKNLRKDYSDLIRVDLGLEVTFQLAGQILFLLLSSTTTATTGGLEQMFNKSSDALLALSIMLSIKSIYFVSLKCITILKTFLPFTTKFFLMLWIMVSSTARVMSLVFFFIPSLGLLSILGHWKLEQTPYSYDIKARFEKNTTVYLYNSEPVAWTDLCRYNYTSDSGPDYTVYTYFNLQQYFCGFWILLVLHVIVNALAKIICSGDFRTNKTSSLLLKLVHCVENTNIPTVWVDWDEREGTLEEHKERHDQVLTEMNTMMAIRTFFNAVLLAPIVYTATNIWERHRLVKSTIGAMNMEQISYDNVTSLFYCIVVVFPVLVVLEFILYWLYQNKFHPWVEILNDDVVEDYDVEENDQDPNNDQISYLDPDNDQIPYIDQDPANEQDLEDGIICYLRPLKITAI